MANETCCNIDADFHVRLLIFCPNHMKPPDSFSSVTMSRFGIWLSVIFWLLLICPRVGSNRWSVFDSFSRNFAEKWLSDESEFPRNLEGFELGFVSHEGSKPLSIVYNITPNSDSWLFVTPCSHGDYVINLQSVVSYDDDTVQNRVSTFDEGASQNWYSKVTEVDMEFKSGLGENVPITSWKRQEMHVMNLKLGIMKAFIYGRGVNTSFYMIRQYSGRIDAFYPKVPPKPEVVICTIGKSSSKLRIFVSRAFNTDLYCATFNLEEDLHNFCTAQLRVDKDLFNNLTTRENITIRRPSVFDNHQRPPILKSEFRCFKTNRFEVTLDQEFIEKRIYINIYAVNKATEFTDAYQSITYKWGSYHEGCSSNRNKVDIDKSGTWVMANQSVFFNISEDSIKTTPSILLYQSCVSNQDQNLQVFKRESHEPMCQQIAQNRVKELCKPIQPGQYRFEHEIKGQTRHAMPVGQMFLLNNIQAFPHLDCNNSGAYSLRIYRDPLPNVPNHYSLTVGFNVVRSQSAIIYYFHVLEFAHGPEHFNRTLTQIKDKIQAETNFCHLIYDKKYLKLPILKVKLKGQGCEMGKWEEHKLIIPGHFSKSSIFVVVVQFSRASEWITNSLQFYSNAVFNMINDEEVF